MTSYAPFKTGKEFIMARFKSPMFGHRSQGSVCTPETAYAQKQSAIWLSRLLNYGVPYNESLFECLGWCAGNLKPLLKKLKSDLAKRPPKPKVGMALEAVSEALKSPTHRLADELEDIAEEHPCTRSAMTLLVAQECQSAAKIPSTHCGTYSRAWKQLHSTFGMRDEACALCEFVFINQSFSPVENYFENFLEIHKYGNRRLLAHMLEIQPSVLQSCITELESCGFLDTDGYFRLKDDIIFLWDNSSPAKADKMFCRVLSGPVLPFEDFSIAQEDISQVKALMSRPGKAPIHILLYGPPGTGKTTFARSLGESLGVKSWSVSSRDNDGDDDRRSSLTACLHMASKHDGSFVLVDEAERLLDTDRYFGRQTKDMAWLNDFLEQPGRRIIWITNHVEHIDQAVRRRFTYSIFFDELGALERGKLLRQILARHKVAKRLTGEQCDRLAKQYKVPAAVMEQAISHAKKIYRAPQGFYEGLERFLLSYLTLRRNGTKPPRKALPAANYNLDGVCLEGSAHELMASCARVDRALRSRHGELRPGTATMLFYGPPGTGKTALARYIANELKRECIVKRASDLLSPWVGVAEQQVVEAFSQAEKNGAVLVIDEVDTFLYSRDNAHRSWETSLVNEFLTALEECRGFCICTTNRRGNLDAAAMRRFSHKVAFSYAKQDQILALYESLLAPLCTEPLAPMLREKLLSLASLAPGDFHAVRAQYDSLFSGEQIANHKKLVDALSKEQSLKTETRTRRIGF
jgi:SpoVK/Ycf46/Vps4 family AAA+-type ATPase